jgi:hypothetical protein
MWLAGCSSNSAVRCSGKLEPINAPAPVVSPARALAEALPGAEDVPVGEREP